MAGRSGACATPTGFPCAPRSACPPPPAPGPRPVRRPSRPRHARLGVEELEGRSVPALVAAYGFEDGTGTTTTDNSGGGLTGTLNGVTWVTTGKFGRALSFNGTSNWVTVADAN